MAIMLISTTFEGLVGAVGYIVGTQKTFPVSLRLALVSIISVPEIMVRLKQYLKVLQSIISLCSIFLGHPVYGTNFLSPYLCFGL